MGKENQSIKKSFLNLRNFKFQHFISEAQANEGTVKTFNEDKTKTYYHNEYTQANGLLRKMMIWTETSSHDENKEWQMFAIDLRDEKGEYECLQMYFDSNAAFSFFKRLANTDLTKEVFIKIGKDEKGEGDKKKAYERLDVYQKDAAGKLVLVPYFWNSENPTPKWEEIKGKGKNAKTVWDKSEMLDLFEALMNMKNAEIQDIIKATQRDGVTFEELETMYVKDDKFGKRLNYIQSEESKQKQNTAPTVEDDLPF